MPPENELDLDKLFLPAWAQEPASANLYADYRGEERAPREDRRGPRRGAGRPGDRGRAKGPREGPQQRRGAPGQRPDRGGGRDRRGGPEGRREGRGPGGPRPHGGERRDQRPPAPPLPDV